MTLEADVVQEKRAVWEWIFETGAGSTAKSEGSVIGMAMHGAWLTEYGRQVSLPH